MLNRATKTLMSKYRKGIHILARRDAIEPIWRVALVPLNNACFGGPSLFPLIHCFFLHFSYFYDNYHNSLSIQSFQVNYHRPLPMRSGWVSFSAPVDTPSTFVLVRWSVLTQRVDLLLICPLRYCTPSLPTNHSHVPLYPCKTPIINKILCMGVCLFG